MPLDALCLSGLVHELNGALSGARIDKIYQPGRDEVVLALRAPGGNVKLLLSANPNHPRPQLTQLPRENPDAPPMFCMLLRKHLSGGRILSIAQPHLERVVEIRLEALDELGDRVERRLVLEAMGRHSNLILLDGEGRITDCLRRVDGDMSARRQVLPGLFYRLPPAQAKLDPTALDRGELERLLAAAPPQAQADQWLLDAFGDVESVTVQKDTLSDLGLPYPDSVTLLLRHKGGVQGVLAADVVSRKAVRSFECFGDGIHLFWEGNPKALYEFRDGDKQPVDTYASFEHDSRYSDNIVENAYVDELTNFFGVLKGEESPKWSFEKDLKAIALMDQIENS